MMTKKQQTVKNEPAQSSNSSKQGSQHSAHANPSCSSNTATLTKTLTRIIINYDVGFNNSLYIRGHGANLSWDKGILLKNTKSDEWVWETECAFPNAEFKILINDKTYEVGQNHPLQCGSTIRYKPQF
jgi:hypothetical protein